jgi:hypothetical protein
LLKAGLIKPLKRRVQTAEKFCEHDFPAVIIDSEGNRIALDTSA